MKVSHRIISLAALGLAILALAAPVAVARPAPADLTPAERVVIEPAPAPLAQNVEAGFDWTSAAIGGGFAGGIILLIVWGGVRYRHRREHIGVAR